MRKALVPPVSRCVERPPFPQNDKCQNQPCAVVAVFAIPGVSQGGDTHLSLEGGGAEEKRSIRDLMIAIHWQSGSLLIECSFVTEARVAGPGVPL